MISLEQWRSAMLARGVPAKPKRFTRWWWRLMLRKLAWWRS